jgi:hypothetical protein
LAAFSGGLIRINALLQWAGQKPMRRVSDGRSDPAAPTPPGSRAELSPA